MTGQVIEESPLIIRICRVAAAGRLQQIQRDKKRALQIGIVIGTIEHAIEFGGLDQAEIRCNEEIEKDGGNEPLKNYRDLCALYVTNEYTKSQKIFLLTILQLHLQHLEISEAFKRIEKIVNKIGDKGMECPICRVVKEGKHGLLHHCSTAEHFNFVKEFTPYKCLICGDGFPHSMGLVNHHSAMLQDPNATDHHMKTEQQLREELED